MTKKETIEYTLESLRNEMSDFYILGSTPELDFDKNGEGYLTWSINHRYTAYLHLLYPRGYDNALGNIIINTESPKAVLYLDLEEYSLLGVTFELSDINDISKFKEDIVSQIKSAIQEDTDELSGIVNENRILLQL